jgi:dienelactone hydrolase
VSGEVADPRLRRLAPRYAELIEAAGLSPADVSAAAVWTAADGRGPLRAVAADVASGRVQWEARPVCAPDGDHRLCRGVMAAWDYRQADGLVDAPPAAPWSLPVRLYLPPAPGPAPLVLFGHGLNSSPSEAGSVADRVSASLGLAVASVAAMHHGDHPTAVDGTDPLAFLGVTLEGLQVDAIAMRASFDQTTADRLQLLQLLRAEPDVDGDGVDDIDSERISYLGISLGGLLGPALLANDDDVDAAALVVGGGYLIRFVTDMELTKLAMPLLASIMGGQDALDRWLIVAQTAVDGSDPAAWATDVLGDRAAAPHLLLEVATQDEVVPPATGQALARALGLPHVAPVAEAVSLVSPVLEAPVESVDGARVVGFLQLDRVSGDDGVEVAVHHNTPMSPEGELVWRSFLEGFADGAGPRILDPYAALGTPALTP